MDLTSDFLVIGAGLGGVAAASRLVASGQKVIIVDKARGVGGRAATKRLGDLRVDTGAQFFTTRDAELTAWVASRLGAGARGEIFEWARGFPLWKDGQIVQRDGTHPRYACRSGMSQLAKLLASGLEPVLGQPVISLERWSGRYRATLADGTTFEATSLILNLPPVQLVALAAPLLDPSWTEAISDVHLEPCFAIYGELESDLQVDWMGLEFEGHATFRWIARDHTRRAPGARPVLLAHTTALWSQERLEDSPDAVAAEAARELERLLGARFRSAPQAHRWRYARPTADAPQKISLETWSAATRIGVCGDWLRGGRVEGAILSGWDLARQITR